MKAALEATAPPDYYKGAHTEWAKWCRKMLRYNRRGIDSEARMKAAVKKGLYDDEGRLEMWEEACAEYKRQTGLNEPPVKYVWISDEIVEEVRAWLSEHEGLVWVRHVGIGERLSRELGIPYYGAEGLDANGTHIKKHPGGSAIASLAANGTGRNLQHFWHKNLWLCAPNEQALGRTHRHGQPKPVVYNWVYVGCYQHLKSFYAASNQKAKFAEEMTMSPQKLRYAKIHMPRTRELEERGGARWANPKE